MSCVNEVYIAIAVNLSFAALSAGLGIWNYRTGRQYKRLINRFDPRTHFCSANKRVEEKEEKA